MNRIFIFDVGNVLMSFLPLAFLNDRYADRDLANRLETVIFESPVWAMLDRGSVTDRQAIDILSGYEPDIANEISEVILGWTSIMKPIEENISLLYELKKQEVKLYYLSNMPLTGADYLPANYDYFRIFSGGIFSARERLAKPEPEIYELLLKRYALDRQACVFIDDSEANTDAASDLGIKSVLYKNPEQLINEISALRDDAPTDR